MTSTANSTMTIPSSLKGFFDYGDATNEVRFPAPQYTSLWLDEQHVVIGGGGGATKFGFKNALVVLRVKTEEEMKAEKAPGALPWEGVQAIDMGEDVIWCCTELVSTEKIASSSSFGSRPGTPQATVMKTSPKSPKPASPLPTNSSFAFAVSSVDCMVLVGVERTVQNGVSKWTLKKLAREVLETDEQNPDKKPLAISDPFGKVYVAQDKCQVDVYDVSSFAVAANSSFSSKPKDAKVVKLGTIDKWQGRIRSLNVQTLQNGGVILATVSEDKKARFLLLSLTASSVVVDRTLEYDETKFKLPFKFMKSSLRSIALCPRVSTGQRALTASTVIVNTFDSHSGITYLLTMALEYTKKGFVLEEQSRFTLEQEGVTYMSVVPHVPTGAPDEAGGDSEEVMAEKAHFLLSTVEGNIYLLLRSAPTTPMVIVKKRATFHTEPISSVTVSRSGAVVSTDIAQRVLLSQVPLLAESSVEQPTKQIPLLFPPKSMFSVPVRIIYMLMFLFSVIFAWLYLH